MLEVHQSGCLYLFICRQRWTYFFAILALLGIVPGVVYLEENIGPSPREYLPRGNEKQIPPRLDFSPRVELSDDDTPGGEPEGIRDSSEV